MFGLSYFKFPKGLLPKEWDLNWGTYMTNDENLNLVLILVCLYIVFKKKNSMQLAEEFDAHPKKAIWMSFLFVLSILGLNRVTDFIYFNF